VLLNAGAIHHVGPHRMWVSLARRLAPAGYTVLRFDHAGLGDSPHRDDGLAFEEASVADVRDALDWLEAHTPCRAFTLLGLCSGTLTAFRAAQRDARVSRLVLLTALLEDPSTVPPEVVAEATERRVGRSYMTQKAASGAAWRRLMTGQVDARKVVRALRRTVVPSVPQAVRPGTAAVVGGLEALLAKGVAVLFVFAEPTTVLEYFRMTLEPHLPALRRRGRVELTVLHGAEHTFTERRHQEQVMVLVSDWLDR
jgi:pimeloyl-ACP methyl ester carboxylesterase